jgi:hypothetical protein
LAVARNQNLRSALCELDGSIGHGRPISALAFNIDLDNDDRQCMLEPILGMCVVAAQPPPFIGYLSEVTCARFYLDRDQIAGPARPDPWLKVRVDAEIAGRLLAEGKAERFKGGRRDVNAASVGDVRTSHY